MAIDMIILWFAMSVVFIEQFRKGWLFDALSVKKVLLCKLLGLMGILAFSNSWAEPVSTSISSMTSPKACVKVLGEADMALGEVGYVRQLAIRDALKTASMQRNLQVLSKQETHNFQLTRDQTHFITHSRILGFKILSEGPKPLTDAELYDEEGKRIKDAKPKLYQVVLNVCLTQENSACAQMPITPYQLRLAVAPPLVMHPEQARDLKELVLGVQSELLRRFRQLAYQNVVSIAHTPGFQTTQLIEPNLSPDLLQNVRYQTDAQFVLLPVIRSTALIQQNGVAQGLKRFYLLDNAPSQRHLEMDVYLVDLFQYRLAKQFRVGFDVEGSVLVGRDKPVGSSAFFTTTTGKVMHQLLQSIVLQTQQFLKCQPLQAEIIDQSGTQYIVNIHQSSGVKVGDQFSVFHHNQAPVRFQSRNLGYDQTESGFLVVKRVFPEFVVTEVSGKKQPVAIGDVVKAW